MFNTIKIMQPIKKLYRIKNIHLYAIGTPVLTGVIQNKKCNQSKNVENKKESPVWCKWWWDESKKFVDTP